MTVSLDKTKRRTFYVHDADLGEGVSVTLEGAKLVAYDDMLGPVDLPTGVTYPLKGGELEQWLLRKVDDDYKPTGHGKHAAGHDGKTCQSFGCVWRRLTARYPQGFEAETWYTYPQEVA